MILLSQIRQIQPDVVQELHLRTAHYEQYLYFAYNDLYKVWEDAVNHPNPGDEEMVKAFKKNPPTKPTEGMLIYADFLALGNTLFIYGLIG